MIEKVTAVEAPTVTLSKAVLLLSTAARDKSSVSVVDVCANSTACCDESTAGVGACTVVRIVSMVAACRDESSDGAKSTVVFGGKLPRDDESPWETSRGVRCSSPSPAVARAKDGCKRTGLVLD